jgi:hypothetical protein
MRGIKLLDHSNTVRRFFCDSISRMQMLV